MSRAEDSETTSPNVATSSAPEDQNAQNAPPTSSARDSGPTPSASARGRGHRRTPSNRTVLPSMQQLQISDPGSLSDTPARRPSGDQFPSWTSQPGPPFVQDPYGHYRYAPGQYPPMQWLPVHPSMGYSAYRDPRSGVYYDPRFQGMPYQPVGFPFPSPVQGPYSGVPEPNMPVMPNGYQQLQQRLPPTRQRPLRSPKNSTEFSQAYDFDVSEAENNPESCRKTLMLRNIPNKYSIHMLLEMLDKAHRKPADEMVYDFCYLPIDFKNRCNLGYAFVNFTDAQATLECYKTFHGKRWNDFNSKKVCEVKYGRVQGRDALIEHFKNSKFPNNDTDSLPLLFEQVVNDDGTKKVRSVPLHSRQTPLQEDL